MYKPEYGHPVVTLRIPPEVLAAAKICARRHDTTLSGLIRDLLQEQLKQDGITPTAKPIDGQIGI